MRLIDADALYDEMLIEMVMTGFQSRALSVIVTAPTIDPIKHGHWEEKQVCENIIKEWQSTRCSVCGKYHTTPFMYYMEEFEYCPRCGARMDGESDE